MTTTNDGKRKRVYQQWQGNETFFCWGYLVGGPNWRASLGTAFLLLAPSGIFLGFVAPYVTREVHAIIMVFSVLLPVLCGIFLFLTACRDPGVIPRQEPDDEYLAGRKPRTQEVMVNGHRVVIRYNDTCHLYQPPRAHHCSVNDNCIERFDHHCPWVGTTIGKRNYRTFLLFIYTATVLCLYVIGVCLAQLFLKHRELVHDDEAKGGDGSGKWGKSFAEVIPAMVIMFYTFVFVWFVGGLSGFHCYLVATNQTTYENFRYNHDSRPNPFDLGILRNCAEVWCTRVPASQVDFRAYVDAPDHISGGHVSGDLEMNDVAPGDTNNYSGQYSMCEPPQNQAPSDVVPHDIDSYSVQVQVPDQADKAAQLQQHLADQEQLQIQQQNQSQGSYPPDLNPAAYQHMAGKPT